MVFTHWSAFFSLALVVLSVSTATAIGVTAAAAQSVHSGAISPARRNPSAPSAVGVPVLEVWHTSIDEKGQPYELTGS